MYIYIYIYIYTSYYYDGGSFPGEKTLERSKAQGFSHQQS